MIEKLTNTDKYIIYKFKKNGFIFNNEECTLYLHIVPDKELLTLLKKKSIDLKVQYILKI